MGLGMLDAAANAAASTCAQTQASPHDMVRRAPRAERVGLLTAGSLERMLAVLSAIAAVVVAVMAFAVADASATTVFTSSGSFSGGGSDPGLLLNPQRAAVRASTGELFVADRDNDRVQIFDTATDAVVGQFGDSATTDDPVGIAVDQASGDVYVSSGASKAVTKWSDGGLAYVQDLLFTSPAPLGDPAQDGELGSFASALAVDPTNGDLLVGDAGRQLIQRYDDSGVFQSAFNGDTSPGGQAFGQIRDIATDPATGDLYVVDGGRVVRFNQDNSYDLTLDSVSGPGLVAVDPSTGDAIVATNADDGCAVDRLAAFDSSGLVSSSVIPPEPGDCAFPVGLGFTATGRLYAPTSDVCGGGCGGVTAIHALNRTLTVADATSDPATAVTETAATLHGTVNPLGDPVTYRFEYSSDGGASWSQAPEQGPVTGNGPIAVQTTVSGLADGASYVYRLSVKDGSTRVYSGQQSLTTVDGDPPVVVLDPVSDLTSSDFTLHGRVNAKGFATSYRLEYSSDGGGSWTTLPGPDGDPNIDDQVGALTTDVAVSDAAGGLLPNQAVSVRLIATNLIGTVEADDTVTTVGMAPTLDGATPAASQITHLAARLSGMINPHNTETAYHFEYGTTAAYGASTPDASAGAGNADQAVSRDVAGLAPATTYHFKLVADNGFDGPVASGDQTFTTGEIPPNVTTGAVSAVGRSTATVAGTVDTHGLAGTFRIAVIQTDGVYSDQTAPVALQAIDGPQAVQTQLAGLPAAGTFTARVAATTAGGQRFGALASFSTSAPAGYVPQAASPAENGDWFTGLQPPPAKNPSPPSNLFTVNSKVNGAAVILTVEVPGRGLVTVKGRGLIGATKHLTDKGAVRLTVRLTKAASKALHGSKTGRLKVRVTIRYIPTGGTLKTITRTVTFKRGGNR